MKKYFKSVKGGWINSISTGTGGEEITQEEYENLLSIIRNRPAQEAGFDYKLRTDLSWELVEAIVEPVDDEIGAEQALNIILGGET